MNPPTTMRVMITVTTWLDTVFFMCRPLRVVGLEPRSDDVWYLDGVMQVTEDAGV
jgi:hypothetical protein